MRDAVTNNTLKMDAWHTDKSVDETGAYCGTTHCWAGWIVAIAGPAGKELEERLTTPIAALKIIHESSPIHVGMVRFFETNEEAMKHIIDCAEREEQLNTQP